MKVTLLHCSSQSIFSVSSFCLHLLVYVQFLLTLLVCSPQFFFCYSLLSVYVSLVLVSVLLHAFCSSVSLCLCCMLSVTFQSHCYPLPFTYVLHGSESLSVYLAIYVYCLFFYIFITVSSILLSLFTAYFPLVFLSFP